MGKIQSPEAVQQHQSTATWGNISTLSESRKREGLLSRHRRRPGASVERRRRDLEEESRSCRGCPTMARTTSTRNAFSPRSTTRTASTRSSRTPRTATSSPTSTRAPTRARPGSRLPETCRATARRLASPKTTSIPICCSAVRSLACTSPWTGQEVDPPPEQPADDRGARPRDPGTRERVGPGDVRPRLLRARRLLAAPARHGGRVPEGRPHLPVKPGLIEVTDTGKARGSQGQQLWMSENRPMGAVVTYWVKDAPKTLKSDGRMPPALPTRRRKRRRIRRRWSRRPKWMKTPQTLLTISDAAGKVVRRLTAPGTRGIHRFVWNLRGVAPTAQGGGFGGGGGGGADQADRGPSDVPGGSWGRQFRRARHLQGVAVAARRWRPQRAGRGADDCGRGRPGRVDCAGHPRRGARVPGEGRQAPAVVRGRVRAGHPDEGPHHRDPPRPRRLASRDQDARRGGEPRSRATEVGRQLRGDETLRGLESGSPSSIQSRVNSAAAGTRSLSGAPTGTQQMNYTIAAEQLAAEVAKLKALEAELKVFEQKLEAAGVPYTAGAGRASRGGDRTLFEPRQPHRLPVVGCRGSQAVSALFTKNRPGDARGRKTRPWRTRAPVVFLLSRHEASPARSSSLLWRRLSCRWADVRAASVSRRRRQPPHPRLRARDPACGRTPDASRRAGARDDE